MPYRCKDGTKRDYADCPAGIVEFLVERGGSMRGSGGRAVGESFSGVGGEFEQKKRFTY